MRRKKHGYFNTEDGAPEPLAVTVRHRVGFGEVDAMAIAWHGRYPQYFALASEELCRRIGLSYRRYYESDLRAPIVQFHVDFHAPVRLDEEIQITARLVWSEAARLNTEFEIRREGGTLAASGYTVQMFVVGQTGEPCVVAPALLAECQRRWKAGEFSELQ